MREGRFSESSQPTEFQQLIAREFLMGIRESDDCQLRQKKLNELLSAQRVKAGTSTLAAIDSWQG